MKKTLSQEINAAALWGKQRGRHVSQHPRCMEQKGTLLRGRRCAHMCTCLHKLYLIFDVFSKKHMGH